MSFVWNGITKSKILRDDEVKIRHRLADAAKVYNWEKTLEILNKRPDLINTTRLNGQSLYTPFHQAAHGNAPVKIVRQMIEIGAWRTLKNADGERPINIAKNKKHQLLVKLLKPVYKTSVPIDIIQDIQKYFHLTILNRAKRLIEKNSIRLPELEPLLEINKPQMYFSIPGMYGGFRYWLDDGKGENTKLISESWCRIAGGSGQRHEITREGTRLVERGFM